MVSLNAIMVDGTGMCGSCRVTVGGEIKFACVDGPDFDGHQVDFKELLRARSASRAGGPGQRRLRPYLQPREAAGRGQDAPTRSTRTCAERHQVAMPERDASSVRATSRR
jgi:glutamate synthase (NADPH/NADH) small chain